MITATVTTVYLLIGAIGIYGATKKDDFLDELIEQFIDQFGLYRQQGMIMAGFAVGILALWGPALVYVIYTDLKEKNAK